VRFRALRCDLHSAPFNTPISTFFNAGYVLMQRIFPLPQKTACRRLGALQLRPSTRAGGVSAPARGSGHTPPEDPARTRAGGVTSGSRGGVLVNAYAGYLLRTKPEGVDEGGVASGYSVLNSVILD
jgi:hypothetical protein